MVESQIQKEIARRGSDKAKIAGQIIKTPGLLVEIVNGLSSEKASIKFGCAKVLLLISETKPEALYSKFDLFVKMGLKNTRVAVRRKAERFLRKHTWP